MSLINSIFTPVAPARLRAIDISCPRRPLSAATENIVVSSIDLAQMPLPVWSEDMAT
jgi:hypothetical protein